MSNEIFEEFYAESVIRSFYRGNLIDNESILFSYRAKYTMKPLSTLPKTYISIKFSLITDLKLILYLFSKKMAFTLQLKAT